MLRRFAGACRGCGLVCRYRSLRDLLQAPVGHRQSTLQKVQDIQENSSADQAMKKIDEDLKKKLQGICRGC